MKAIVITGMIGCGNTTIGELLAKKLGIEFFSVGKLFKEKVHAHGKKETEKNINYLRSVEGSSRIFHEDLDDLQVGLAKKGDIVIESKLGIHFLKDFSRSIWLTAPEKVRAERIAKREGWDFEHSLVQLREKQRLEREVFKNVYGFDYIRQEEQAEFIIDTSNKTPDAIVDEIIEKLALQN